MPRTRVVAPAAIVLLLTCICFCTATHAWAQSAGTHPKGIATGMIVGQVVEAGSNRGVSGAVVTLTGDALGLPASSPGAFGMAPPGVRVMTMRDGQFFFRALPKGTYSVGVTKPGYLPSVHGARAPGGASQPIELDEGQRIPDAVVTLWRYGAITGTIVDERGEAAVGIPVRAFRRVTVGGHRRFNPVAGGMTDDRGVYRIPLLTPGDYIVAVVSTQVAVPTALVDAVRHELETATTPMSSSPRLRLLFDVGATFEPPGSPGAMEVGNLTMTLGRGAVPPPPRSQRLFVYPTTYYPSAATPSTAAAVAVGSGDERSGIDLQIAPVRTARVSGTVMGPDGAAQGVPVRLIPPGGSEFPMPLDTATTITDEGGAFSFPAVPPGQYTLRALSVPRPPSSGTQPPTVLQSGSGMAVSFSMGGPDFSAAPVPAEPTLWAEMPISVGGVDFSNVNVMLRQGARVSGRVEFEGAAPLPPTEQLARIGVFLESAELTAASPAGFQFGRVEANRQFRTYGVPAGKYVLTVVGGMPTGWTLKSIALEGRELTDTLLAMSGSDVSGVVITFTDRPATLSGAVHNGEGGAADRDATVIVFPSDPQSWTVYGRNPRRLRSVRTSRAGTYTFTGLPPGDYFVTAVAAESAPDWQDPKFLEGIAQIATHVRIQDGEKRTQDLQTK